MRADSGAAPGSLGDEGHLTWLAWGPGVYFRAPFLSYFSPYHINDIDRQADCSVLNSTIQCHSCPSCIDAFPASGLEATKRQTAEVASLQF